MTRPPKPAAPQPTAEADGRDPSAQGPARGLALRIAAFVERRRRWIVVVWLVLVVAAMPLAARQTEDLSGGGFEVPGSGSAEVERALEQAFGEQREGAIAAVLRVEGPTDPAASDERQAAGIGAAVARLRDAVARTRSIRLAPRAAKRAEAGLRRSGVAFVPLRSGLPASELNDPAAALRDALRPGRSADGVTPYLVGQPAAYAGLQELSKHDLERAELTGFPIVALILLAVFGSLAAASLPLALGFGSVIVTGALIYLLSQQMEMSVFVTNMASMIGIGVAVDYSLFILARFREEVRSGRSLAAARAEALATSGLAVAFSGLAVVISLAGLWMIDNQTLRSMALGAMIVVAISVLTATILLTALISVLGHRVEAGGRVWSVMSLVRRAILGRRRRRGSSRGEHGGFWEWWTGRVMARPWRSVGLSAGVLLILAIPVLSMKTGTGALDQFPPGHDVREGAALAAAQTGGGANPIEIVARFRGGGRGGGAANRRATDRLVERIARRRGVAEVASVRRGDGATLIEVVPAGQSESDRALALVERLRDVVVPRSSLAERASVAVGGESARIVDVRAQIDSAIWKIIAFILGFSFFVLMVMLRSVVLPLKAIAMNLLSIGAAYGVLVAVFQWGWLDGFLGFESIGAIDTLTPPLMLAVVFGLSMDYEVFLLSRIRERYESSHDNRRAVAEGLASSARTISSAALIMTAVFAVFVLTGVPSIKELGLGNAVAIALDATLVRLVLVPATMALLGRWNWWLPGWLDRLLPDLRFESGGHRVSPRPLPVTVPEGRR